MRKNYLDVAKLFAVICVMNVHASVTYNPVRRTISAFFMPVFFIIYGMASSGKPLKSWQEIWQFLEKRTRSLLVPYVLWALIYAGNTEISFVKGVLLGTNPSLGEAGTNQVLWFLPCMFIAAILFQVYTNIDAAITNKTGKIGFAALAMLICGTISCKFNTIFIFGSDIALSGCIFMIIGRKIGWGGVFETFWRNKPNIAKFFTSAMLLLFTYVIVTCNLSYLEQGGHHGVVMALAVYGRYDLFLIGAVTGSIGLLLIAMVFEDIKFFTYMGRFSLVIMAVHYIIFPYVMPVCSRILDMSYGELIYPAMVAVGCFAICVPLCYIIDWAVPELNGKAIRQTKKE